MDDARKKLIKLLQKAFSGEMAAALAYNGHWRSLKKEEQIRTIQRIEQDEWTHREMIRKMLAELTAEPLFFREALFYMIGRSIGFICHFCGNFCASYFAGILESRNVDQYAAALKYAEEAGLKEYFESFREMRAVEAEHEKLLLEMIADYRLLNVFSAVFGWGKSL